MKPFEDLITKEVAELTQEQIQAYIKETGDENMVLSEVSKCRNLLDKMGIEYKKQ